MRARRLSSPLLFRNSFRIFGELFGFLIFVFSANLVRTSTIPLSEIPLGKVVSVNGLKFIKIAENQYMAASAYGTMQGWDGCEVLATPTYTAGIKSTYFTQGPILMDARNGKKYEIRKFPDGKCWMVDNLRYDGQTDNCNGRTAFDGYTMEQTNRFGSGTYGDCRDPHVGGSAPCNTNTAAGVPQCGYYYNWQAVMQAASAYYNVSYATTYPHQGICPTGWHVPRGGVDDDSEFVKLDKSVGGTGAIAPTGTNYTAFWKPTSPTAVTITDPWKGIYTGSCDGSGGLEGQSVGGVWWSSSEISLTGVYFLLVHTSFVFPQNNATKDNGFTVRCVKN